LEERQPRVWGRQVGLLDEMAREAPMRADVLVLQRLAASQ
jgi:hypothetical protein